jgi:hypothetical protein
MAMRGLLLAAVAACGLAAALPAVARADTVVPADRTVNEITVVGDDVVLQGTSLGSVMVIGGDLMLGPGATADDGITVIGGTITTAPTATVNGDVLQIGASVPRPSGMALAVALLVLLAGRLLCVWLIVRLAVLIAPRESMAELRSSAAERPVRTALVGALLLAGLGAAAILMALTVVGIVFSLAIGGLLMLFAALGCALVPQHVPGEPSQRRTLLVALAVPLLGDAVLALATIAGAGAIFHHVVSRRDQRPVSTAPSI